MNPWTGTQTLLHHISDIETFKADTPAEKELKIALAYLLENNHLFQKFENSYTLQLKNNDIDQNQFEIKLKKDHLDQNIHQKCGAIINIEEHSEKIENINDCTEAFVVNKDDQKNDLQVTKDFKIQDVKWNQEGLEEMIFPWLFPKGTGG